LLKGGAGVGRRELMGVHAVDPVALVQCGEQRERSLSLGHRQLPGESAPQQSAGRSAARRTLEPPQSVNESAKVISPLGPVME
jgi:hypothetical protein